MRKERFETGMSRNQCLLSLIILMLILQTAILAVPFYFGFQFVQSNKETIEAFTNMNGKELLDDTTTTIGNGKAFSFKALELMNQFNQLSSDVKNKTNIFNDVQHLIISLEKSFDEIGQLLSPYMRQTLMKILNKTMKMMEHMSDNEIHDFITHIDNAVKIAVTDQTVHKTLHTMEDADNFMLKVDKFLSKFTN